MIATQGTTSERPARGRKLLQLWKSRRLDVSLQFDLGSFFVGVVITRGVSAASWSRAGHWKRWRIYHVHIGLVPFLLLHFVWPILEHEGKR